MNNANAEDNFIIFCTFVSSFLICSSSQEKELSTINMTTGRIFKLKDVKAAQN